MTTDQQTLWTNIKALVFFGWVVAAIRLLLDFVAPDQSMYIGVYWMMPLAYLYFGLKGRWDHLPWRRVAVSLLAVVLLVWFIPNWISYSTAALVGLDHGRFSAESYQTVIERDTPIKIILNAGIVSAATFGAGSVWSLSLGTLFIWLPGALRRRQG